MSALHHRAADTVRVALAAAVIAAAMALPVLRAPTTLIVGAEIVGRHHDPFTVMRQFAQPTPLGAYSQPLTDVPGSVLAAVAGPVAAYNWLVLLTFPLAAATAFLLARHLGLSRLASTFAALVFAFSPFHIAQAAYHPHVAQVQWMPLYLLALWRSLDRWSPAAAIAVVLTAAAVALSNLYAGLIAAVVTPVAIGAYWVFSTRHTPASKRSLVATVSTLVLLAVGGFAYVWVVAPVVLQNPGALGVDRAQLFVYSAKWWSYLVPPVINPWIGDSARQMWTSINVREGLLEQQVTLGTGVVLLGFVAIGGWVARRRVDRTLRIVPVLAIVALTALVCSLSPERVIGGVTVARPSAWLYAIAPMFRSYARFGIVVQLMAALLAGVGLDLLRRGRRVAMFAAVTLVALVAAEYAVAPSTMSRDVLPTPAHRWIADQAPPVRALDCVPHTVMTSVVPWLTKDQIVALGGPVTDCFEPNLPGKLRALGLTHIIVRHSSEEGRWLDGQLRPGELQRVETLAGWDILEVQAPHPAVYTSETLGFFPREFDEARTWQWMEGTAVWGVVNTTPETQQATLSVELEAFHTTRHIEVLVDGQLHQVLVVDPERRAHETTPMHLSPGKHALTFRAVEPPTVVDAVAHNGDTRALSVSIGTWTWTVTKGIPPATVRF
jgi:hypothetical protein